jgi:hypothetical protein
VVGTPFVSSGSSSSSSCVAQWSCSSWGACVGGVQTRVCTKINDCTPIYGEPSESRSCIVGGEGSEEEVDDDSTDNPIVDDYNPTENPPIIDTPTTNTPIDNSNPNNNLNNQEPLNKDVGNEGKNWFNIIPILIIIAILLIAIVVYIKRDDIKKMSK